MRRFIGFIFLLFLQTAQADLHPAPTQIMPRTILILTERDQLNETQAFLYGTFPLNYLGYRVEYADLHQSFPEHLSHDRYAGIIVWPSTADKPSQPLHDWLIKQIQADFPVVFFNFFGFTPTADNLAPLGIDPIPHDQDFSRTQASIESPLIGYEIQPLPEQLDDTLFHLKTGQSLLRIGNQHSYSDVISMMPWGGYALSSYIFKTLPNEQNRWIINPIEFYRQALRLPDMPVPDVTTENGRRLMMVHVDGDGFISRTEWDQKQLAGEAMLTQIFERFQIPTTASVIIGEIAPFGIAPQSSAQAMNAARAIFQLPWVEIASHTYSHPFRWAEVASHSAEGKNTEGEALTLKGYRFNVATEVTGSIDFINRYLAPPGKVCRVILWSGDTYPSEDALKLAYADHVANMNGGDTTITQENNSLTNIAPLGVDVGGYFQVYAPSQNENVFTNDWRGPFYGFVRVIETFQLTNTPLRFKPIDLYFHFYSATKIASIDTLKTVYTWALSQPVMNIYVSDYFNKVLDSNALVVIKTQNGFIIHNRGELRELRAPRSLGKPDLLKSQNLIGYSAYGNDYFLHLGPAITSTLYFLPTDNLKTNLSESDLLKTVQWLMNLPYLGPLVRGVVILPKESGVPYLIDANGRVTAFSRGDHSLTLRLEGYLPLVFTLGNMTDCTLSSGHALIQGRFLENNQEQFELKDRSADLRIVCQ